MLDLDRFKPVNDTLGHPTGDEILRMIGVRLLHAVRRDDMVARIGGDEFAIIAADVTEDEAIEIARRIVEVVARPFVIGGNVAELGGSVGIVRAPDHGSNADDLIKHVDIALYTAKRLGKNQAQMFAPDMVGDLQDRREMEADLRRACSRDDFRVVYQPVIAPGTGKFTGAEALLRWTSPTRGVVPPAIFIPIAEELGLISRIGTWVLQQACRDAATWPDDIDISVNLSPVQLLDPRLVQTVTQALADSGLPPHGWNWRLPKRPCSRMTTPRSPPCAGCRNWASAFRSTISGPGIPRYPISTVFRSAGSRSTDLSCAACRPIRAAHRSSRRSRNWGPA